MYVSTVAAIVALWNSRAILFWAHRLCWPWPAERAKNFARFVISYLLLCDSLLLWEMMINVLYMYIHKQMSKHDEFSEPLEAREPEKGSTIFRHQKVVIILNSICIIMFFVVHPPSSALVSVRKQFHPYSIFS